MILVTGAAGKTGATLCRALAARRAAVRAFVHHAAQGPTMRALGVTEVVAGDMRNEADVTEAVNGVQAIYHICPNMDPEEVAIGHLLAKIAVEERVRRLVFHSVLHPQTEEMPHHWRKLRVEEQLFRTGLPVTILQPAPYMQNILPGWERIVSHGVYRIPYAAETRLGLVDLHDVAEAAAIVLTEPGHEGAVYELAGGEVLTQNDVAKTLSRALGRTVRAEVQPIEEWEDQARARGLGTYQVATLVQMFRYYERYGLWGNPTVLRGLLHRDPTSFAAFVQRTLDQHRHR